MNATQRREKIFDCLARADRPVSAGVLARELSVSRQVIVGDVALLRAGGADIVATPRGYVTGRREAGERFTVACRHRPEDMERELNLMVDNGCTVENVIVEHSVYGQLVGLLMVSSRYDVSEFIRAVIKSGAKPLSDLTGGIHLHTLLCADGAGRERVVRALGESGFLLE